MRLRLRFEQSVYILIVLAAYAPFSIAVGLFPFWSQENSPLVYWGLLQAGRVVFFVKDVDAELASDSRYFRNSKHQFPRCWPDQAQGGMRRVLAGTGGIVVEETAHDEDDCYGDRPIVVELLDGAERGAVVLVARGVLRDSTYGSRR
jgi:hypothetical protein